MTRSSAATQETVLEQMPFSVEEWARTPPAVQEFVLSLTVHVQALEAEVAALREQLNRNSRNSSQPPSSDGPEVPPKPRQRAKSKRKRGAQPGHKGTTRKLVPIEQVKESYDVKPDACRHCGHALEGEDPEPYRHQVTEIPPVVAEVTEYRLHTLTCPECRAETRAELPAGVPQGTFGPRLQAMPSLLSGRYRLGIVGSDRWSAYNWLITLLRQFCWAHLLRDFQAFGDRGGESQSIGEALLAQADLMFEWWHKVRDGTMDRATFQVKMQPVQRQVGQLLHQGTNCDHSKTAGTCRDILKREEALWTFPILAPSRRCDCWIGYLGR
jgi:hypothetical protein